MKKKRAKYGALCFAIILFANPNFNCFDFFPDFIAAFIIASLLFKIEEIVPYAAEGARAFTRFGIVSLLRFPAALIMFASLNTGMDIVPLFTLIFTVSELIFLFPAVTSSARALTYLGERTDAVALVSPRPLGSKLGIDGLRNIAPAFFSVRALLNLIPQFCHLTFSDERMQYISNRLYAPLEIVGLLTVAVLGLAFAVFMIAYLRAVKREGKLTAAVISLAGEEKIALLDKSEQLRRMKNSLTLFAFFTLASFDIILQSQDNFNVLPRFIFLIPISITVFRLADKKALGVGVLLSSISASVVSTVGYLLTRAFSDEYGIEDILENTVAKSEYSRIEVLAVSEAVLTLALIALVAVVLCRFVRLHTGMDTGSADYTLTARRHHRELMRRVIILAALLGTVTVCKCVHIFLLGSPVVLATNAETSTVIYAARMPWFPTLTFFLNLATVFYSFHLTATLKEEMKLRYTNE